MHSCCNLLTLLLSPLLLLVATTVPAGALQDDEKHLMVKLHNLYRAQVSPSATSMLQMRWDEELAAFAKAYARQCVWGHNKERGRRGENLFAITDEGMDVPLAVEEWHNEHEHYNFSAATCDPGHMCGHYTQVVWAKTERLGCGSHFCEKLQGVEETNIHLLVCNYEPPGNVKGRRPYQEGTPCSQCPSGYRCENSLCEPIRGPEEAQELPRLATEAPSSMATEASGSSREAIPPSLTSETPFLLTEVSVSPATTALPAVETKASSLTTQGSSPVATEAPPSIETKAPSSLTTQGSSPVATEATPFLTTEVPSLSGTRSLLSFDKGPATSPRSTHDPIPKSADKEASTTRISSRSPNSSLYPKMSLTGTQELLPHSQEEDKAKAKLPSSGEVLSSVVLSQDEPGEPQGTLDHTEHTLFKFLHNLPNISLTTNILALQSSLPGAEDSNMPHVHSGLDLAPGHVWSPFLCLLLLLPLVLAGIF